MKKLLGLIVLAVAAFWFANQWQRRGRYVDSQLGEGTWQRAKLWWKIQATLFSPSLPSEPMPISQDAASNDAPLDQREWLTTYSYRDLRTGEIVHINPTLN